MSNPSSERGRYRWRIIGLWSAVLIAVAIVIYFLAHVSLVVALLAAVMGSLFNGLMLIGGKRPRRNSNNGSRT